MLLTVDGIYKKALFFVVAKSTDRCYQISKRKFGNKPADQKIFTRLLLADKVSLGPLMYLSSISQVTSLSRVLHLLWRI